MNLFSTAGSICKTALLAGMLGMAASQGAFAQEVTEEHLKAARAAVAASASTTSLDNILPQIGEKAKEQLITNRPDEADKISAVVDDATIALAARRRDLEDEVARIYANVFSAEELKTIEEFYKTEAGQKLIRETPVIARSMDQAARVWTNGVQRDLSAEVAKRLKEAGLE